MKAKKGFLSLHSMQRIHQQWLTVGWYPLHARLKGRERGRAVVEWSECVYYVCCCWILELLLLLLASASTLQLRGSIQLTGRGGVFLRAKVQQCYAHTQWQTDQLQIG